MSNLPAKIPQSTPVPTKREARLSTSDQLARLRPPKYSIGLPDRELRVYVKEAPKPLSAPALTNGSELEVVGWKPRDVKYDTAQLTVIGGKTLQVSFYPNAEAGQVVMDLPLEKLGEAVEELLLAGF